MEFLLSLSELVSGSENLSITDATNFVKYGIFGFLAFGGLKASQLYLTRNVLPSSQLKYKTESFEFDRIVLDQYLILQKYSKLNPWALQMAITNTDCILFLTQALVTETIDPAKSDKILGFTYFKVASARLDAFKTSVQTSMGTRHAVIVSESIAKIKERLKKHVVTILDHCSKFNVYTCIKNAEAEVEEVLKAKQYH